ncbi:uncharacterized protein LOC115632335 [Scaptodrosophila lebanonensis]|uniref:Uncharacterized protein LOC115632335 n=1 Tax=Drosophila lebanonensis TaxID=7225 RepID=A0A6J2UB97_DROLE|nr:uncharacterized protein LOC115632335 [Scaptodrosophila lebanonensis]
MPVKLELTMEELVRIALGVPELTRVNVAVLQSLLVMLMKKINCQNDLVTITGFESKCMEKILEQSKISPIPFNDENIVPISEKLDKVSSMEKRIEELEHKLEQHFQQIRICNKVNDKKYQMSTWEKYSSPCEDLCTACDEDNKIACSLLQNMDFMKKLLRRVATPILDQLDEISAKLERFYETLKAFLKKADELFERLELVKQCVVEIENLRKLVEEYNLTFIGTMEELQDMLDSKLDKVHMPALKKYIRDRFDDIEVRLVQIESKETCPRAAGFINTNLKCLSCGNTNIGVDVGPQTMGLLPKAVPGKFKEVAHPHGKDHPTTRSSMTSHLADNCSKATVCRALEKEPTIMVRVHNMNLDMLAQRLNRPTTGKFCKLPEANDTIYGVRNSCFSG